MELKQLQYFVVSVDMGSLSHAAEALYTTQSHVSKTVKSLEKELDMELLIRTPNGVVVTEGGKRVYEYARKMLASMQQITDLALEQDEDRLRISSMPSGELARLFADFFEQEQELSVEFQEGSLEHILHQVAHHRVELGFIFVSDHHQQALKNMMRHKRLAFHPLRETKLMLHAGPKNPYYNLPSVSFAELRKLRFVQNQEEEISLIRQAGHLRSNLLDPKPFQIAAVVSNDHAMMQLLERTSLGNISCHLRARSAGNTLLHAIEIQEVSAAVQFGYICYTDQLSAGAEKFLAYLQEALRD